MNNIRNLVKKLIVSKGMTIKQVAQQMSEMTNYKYTGKVITDKLSRETIRLSEFLMILKILGYKIEYKDEN